MPWGKRVPRLSSALFTSSLANGDTHIYYSHTSIKLTRTRTVPEQEPHTLTGTEKDQTPFGSQMLWNVFTITGDLMQDKWGFRDTLTSIDSYMERSVHKKIYLIAFAS